MKRTLIFSLCLYVLLWQYGCVHHPPLTWSIPLSEQEKADLQPVGIVSARFTPDAEFSLPAAGGLAGAGRGTILGGRESLKYGAKVAETIAIPVPLQLMAFLVVTSLALGVVFVPPAALVGGAYGAVASEPAEAIKEADAALKKILTEARLQEVLRDHVTEFARDNAGYALSLLQDQGPSSKDEIADYRSASDTGIHSVLEVSLLEVALLGEWEIDPPLQLNMTIRARLVRTSDGLVLSNQHFTYWGGHRLFTEWAVNDAKPLREEFEKCYDSLAHQIVESVFVRYLPLMVPHSSLNGK